MGKVKVCFMELIKGTWAERKIRVLIKLTANAKAPLADSAAFAAVAAADDVDNNVALQRRTTINYPLPTWPRPQQELNMTGR